jgi:hypothetical protein
MVSTALFPCQCTEADTSQATTPISPIDSRVEMFQRGITDTFFGMKAQAPRPLSEATEMYDTEFEEDENSDIEGEEEEAEGYSPRISLNSVRLVSHLIMTPTNDS